MRIVATNILTMKKLYKHADDALSAVAVITGLLLSVIVGGCSIKEDRSACPCRLLLDFSEVDPVAHQELNLTITDERGFIYSTVLKPVSTSSSDALQTVSTMHSVAAMPAAVPISSIAVPLPVHYEALSTAETHPQWNERYPEEYVVEVPRSGVFVNVWSGVDAELLSDSGMFIPKGRDCPPVYRHFSCISTDAEVMTEKVAMHKQYCGLSLFFVNEDAPYSVHVKGEVNGYANDGNLSSGVFSCPISSKNTNVADRQVVNLHDSSVSSEDITGNAAGEFAVRLPKQSDASLLMDIERDGDVLKTFALGNYIAASGYDWSAEDLDDLTVGIDYSDTKVSLTVSGWKENFTYELVF